MMFEFLYRLRCWLAIVLIVLVAACNVKSDMNNMERMVMEIEGKFNRGEDISQDTSIFQARRYFNVSDNAEMKTLSALYRGCVYWQQSNYDSAMAALNEAIVLAKSSDDPELLEKVQQTIAELHSDLDRSEDMMKGYLRRRRLLMVCSIALLVAAAVVTWLLVRVNQRRKKMDVLNLNIEELQTECEALTEIHRNNLFQRAMTIYKVFLVGEKKDTDVATFQKLKSSVCGSNVTTAYEGIFEAYNQVYPEVVQRIREHQPALTDSEFKVCILSMMPFSVKEVADILKVSSAMIGKARTSIRKKLGIKEVRGSIDEFVMNHLVNNGVSMKRYLILIVLFCLFEGIHAQAIRVYGNLGVENVNISVINTQYGTSSDAKGHYELPIYDRSKTVNLYYSCIGYHDTIVSLSTRQMERDSINISFKMRRQDYELQEVGVTASRDFYRSKRGRNITDMVFLDNNVYLLENKPKASSVVVLDLEGTEKARADYDKLYEKLYIDCFNDVILVGQDSCLQVYLNEQDSIMSVSVFSRALYQEKLLRIVCEFNDAYIIKSDVHDKGLHWIKHNHGKSQDFSYILKNDPNKEPRPLCSFLDTIGYLGCQSQWMSILAEYHQEVAKNDGVDLINEGIWDGYMVSLAENSSLLFKIQWYCAIAAKKEYCIMPLIFKDFLQFVDVDNLQIVEINKDFGIASRHPLKVTSGEKYFKNEFLKDEATGKAYGLFIQNGVNHLGLYDTTQGTVGMGQKASKVAYPRVFKVHDGYAYSVSYDSNRHQGVVGRVKID